MPSHTNWAFPQSVNVDSLELGEQAQRKTTVDWAEAQSVFQNGGSINHIGFFDDFLGDILAAEWVNDLAAGATIAPAGTAAGGIAVVTLDTDDNDHATLTMGLHWTVSNGYTVFTARAAQVTAITLRSVEIGVSDANSETNGLAFSAPDTPTAVADDAAVFTINSDDSLATWNVLTVNGGGTPVQTTLTTAPVAGTYQVFQIVIDSAGNAQFYINGTLEATQALAVATTALLTPWITLKSLSAAAKIQNVDYVSMFGERS